MINDKELFENNCLPMNWTMDTKPRRKELAELLAELEEIKNHIEDIKAKQWHLKKLAIFNKGGLTAE